jgi:mono/diheme cytochrome c family protein
MLRAEIARRRLMAALALAAGLSVVAGDCGGGGSESKGSGAKPKTTQAPTARGSVATGRDVFVANCARCHGQNAEGGFGPQLADGVVVQKYPNADDQIRFVEGHTLPPFRDRLSPEQIRDVVEYTRSLK